jgi:TPP-dependent pyruvate/acetoin dehydrogenase alpha subunit
LVSPTVDLGAGDLVSDALGGGVVEFLRGATLGQALRPGLASKKRRLTGTCGEAARLPSAPGIDARIWAALGAATTLKIQAAGGKDASKVSADAQMGVVVVYLLPGEVPPELWRRALTFAKEQALPVLFVLPPPVQGKPAAPLKCGVLSASALELGVPGIAVDADDAVALYRVAQESIGHARAGGGAALMECVPFVIAGATGKSKPADAIAGLETYMVERGVATRAWLDGQAKSFVARAVKEVEASK